MLYNSRPICVKITVTINFKSCFYLLNFPILNKLHPREFSMSVTIIIISSSPHSANHSLSHQTSCQMHEAPQYSFVVENSPVFHRQTEEDESVHTFRGSFFRRVLAGTRSNDGRRAGMARSFVQINFQRGQGYTRERLRFADRNCRNRDRWIFQRILCSVLAPPRLTAHTFRCQFP